MVLHHTPKIYELIHEGSVSTVTLNQLISMRWCQSPSSIWLELIDQANILLVQCPAFNECYLLHWWRGGKEQKPSLVVISSNVTDGRLSHSQLGVCLDKKTKTFGLCGQTNVFFCFFFTLFETSALKPSRKTACFGNVKHLINQYCAWNSWNMHFLCLHPIVAEQSILLLRKALLEALPTQFLLPFERWNI